MAASSKKAFEPKAKPATSAPSKTAAKPLAAKRPLKPNGAVARPLPPAHKPYIKGIGKLEARAAATTDRDVIASIPTEHRSESGRALAQIRRSQLSGRLRDTPTMHAAIGTECLPLVRALIPYCDLGEVDESGDTALHRVARGHANASMDTHRLSYLRMLKWLLPHSDPNAPGHAGRTPLMLACQTQKHWQTCDALLSVSDLDAVDDEKLTALGVMLNAGLLMFGLRRNFPAIMASRMGRAAPVVLKAALRRQRDVKTRLGGYYSGLFPVIDALAANPAVKAAAAKSAFKRQPRGTMPLTTARMRADEAAEIAAATKEGQAAAKKPKSDAGPATSSLQRSRAGKPRRF